MQAYVLRRDVLEVKDFGVDYVLSATKPQLEKLMNRQLDQIFKENGKEDDFVAIYDALDLEDLINLDDGAFEPKKYYIRIFNN